MSQNKTVYEIAIIGPFGFGHDVKNGQVIKTLEMYKLLAEEYGKPMIYCVDTYKWTKAPWTLFTNIIKAARNSKNVVILPAHNSVKIIPYLLLHTRKKDTKLFYSVIGGWLPDFLDNKPKLSRTLKKLDGIWVETHTMKCKLHHIGFNNIVVVPNFKYLDIVKKEDLVFPELSPLKLCIFSRVHKMKGIADAIRAIVEINTEANQTLYSLDIYGPIADDFKEEFKKLCDETPSYISYKGSIPPEQSVCVLKNYFALLFPTLHPTEGVPGTIIDAYSAGIPVISAIWNSFADIVDDGVTGIGFTQGDYSVLKSTLIKVANDPETLVQMKSHCLDKALNYSPQTAKKLLVNLLDTQKARDQIKSLYLLP